MATSIRKRFNLPFETDPAGVLKIRKALTFQRWAHEGQKRKYTGEPYANHPIAVATIVAEVTNDADMICAALLHDTVEDTDVQLGDILEHFGVRVYRLVFDLTDCSKRKHGTRAQRKEIDREFISMASADAKTIKLADLIDNTRSICEHDPAFAAIYMPEKVEVLKVLKQGNSVLWNRANDIAMEYQRNSAEM